MLPSILKDNWMPGVFDNFLGSNLMNDRFNTDFSASLPSVNIIEDKEEFRIDLAAPGLSKKDFAIDIHNKVLTISSENKDENEEKTENYMRREFHYSSFKRSFSLPETVELDKIKATHQNGILRVHIPKKKEAIDQGPKQISIS
jgi:HSP20 family protein